MGYYSRVDYDSSDYDELLRELEHQPNVRSIVALESVLSTAFAATQAVVHVITGRLKASGRVESRLENDRWTGEITYGGEGTGVDYAWYEERRGGLHDFMNPAEEVAVALDEKFAEAILRTVVRDK